MSAHAPWASTAADASWTIDPASPALAGTRVGGIRTQAHCLVSSMVGFCVPTVDSFQCSCGSGWEGIHCQSRTNLCRNVTCQNRGICRGALNNYTCECLGDGFSGPHCETASTTTTVRTVVSKTFGYVAIVSLVTVVVFVTVMDVMKYWLGIDATAAETEELRVKRAKRRASPVKVRFVYVDHPPETPV